MSLRSMTGFGCGADQAADCDVFVEIRTVNHRYLDVRCHLPREHASLEPALVAAVKASLGRGRVDLTLRVHRSAGAAGGVEADLGAARAVRDALVSVGDALGLAGAPDLATLARYSDRFLVASTGPDSDALGPAVARAVAAALAEVEGARREEGAAIAADIEGRLESLRTIVVSLKALAPKLVDEARTRLTGRIDALLSDCSTALDPARIEHEIAILADKTDVAEELQRLQQHIDTFAAVVRAGDDDGVGRRLDFLAQELTREVNTVASKVSDADVVTVAVDAKSEIERIREQIQNVE